MIKILRNLARAFDSYYQAFLKRFYYVRLSTPVMELDAGMDTSDLNIRSWRGGLILEGDTISLEESGEVITVTGGKSISVGFSKMGVDID